MTGGLNGRTEKLTENRGRFDSKFYFLCESRPFRKVKKSKRLKRKRTSKFGGGRFDIDRHSGTGPYDGQ